MLASTVENWALFFHLLGALLVVSGAVVATVGFETARARHRADEIALLLGLTRIGVALLACGALLVVPFGLWLVQIEHVGYGRGWVDTSAGLFVVAAALGAAGGQIPKRARLLAEQLAPGEGETAELRALLDARGARALNYGSGLLMVAVVALMVFKPGGPA